MLATVRLFALFQVLLLTAVAAAPFATAQGASDAAPANDERIDSVLVFAQPDLTTLDITGAITIRKYDIEGTPYETSDDMGDAYQQMLQADAFAREQGQESNRAEEFVASIQSSTARSVAASLAASYPGAQIEVDEPVLDLATLEAAEGDPYEPGVRLDISARVVRTLEQVGVGGFSEEAMKVAFESGARVSTSVTFTAAAGHNVTYVLEPPATPAGVRFVEAGPAPAAIVDGDLLVVRVDNSRGTRTLAATVDAVAANPDARAYTAEEIADGASVKVKVDLMDVDIELGKAIGGDMGNLVGEITVRTELSLVELPPEFRASLPDNVELATLTSNAIRLLREHDVITQENLDDLERTFLNQVGSNLQSALGTPVSVTGGFAPGTLDAAGLDSTEGGAPLVLEARATFAKSLSGAAPDAQAAVALYTTTQSFTLPRVQGLATSYTIVLPKGLALVGVDAPDGAAVAGTSEDGRDQFTVTPEGERTQATISMAVTPTFVVAKFWPALLLAVVVLMLLVGTPIALFVRNRKGA